MNTRVIYLVSFVVLLTVCVSAQTKGTITGFTKDPTGAFVPGVNVKITDQRTGAIRTAASDQSGFYQVLGLVPSLYTIEVEAPGFKRYRNKGVALQVDQNVRADVLLELGELQQTVEVTGAAAQVDTRSSQSSVTIDDRRIIDLPIGNRNVHALAKIVPGVVNLTALDYTRVGDADSGPTMSVNGGRPNTNYNQFNGIYFMSPRKNKGLNAPPPDAIQEFKIQTSNFTADTGFSPNSTITIASRQGTNDFHGTLWEFLRNDNLNARSFFQQTKPELKVNQYGAAAGGPIQRNKLFIFGTVQMTDDRAQPTTVDALPPSARELQGDFSHLSGKQLYNPFDGTPFPGNQIPVSLFDPAALKILSDFVPTVQNTGDHYQGLGISPRDSRQFMVRSDLVLTKKQTLFGTYYLNENQISIDGVGAYGSSFPGWTGEKTKIRVQTIGITHTYAMSPTSLNQLALGFTRPVSERRPTVSRTPESLGISGLPIYVGDSSPRFTTTGRWTLQSSGKVPMIQNIYQIKDDASLIRGRHTFKVGVMYMDTGWVRGSMIEPTFSFSGVRTGRGVAARGDSLADFVLGAYDSMLVVSGLERIDTTNLYIAPYVSDDFKVGRRLTLNLGLRWELATPWVEKNNWAKSVWTDATIQSTVFPQAPPGMLFPGDTLPSGEKMPRGLRKTDKNNFAPRVGFAYDVFGDGRTAIRGAYGVFYDFEESFTFDPGGQPFRIGSQTYRDGLLSNPYGSIGEVPLPIALPRGEAAFYFPINDGSTGPVNTIDLDKSKVHNWSVVIDREFIRNWAVSLAYIGKHGDHLPAMRAFNAAIFIPGTDANGNPLSTRANINQRVPFLPGIYGPGGLYVDNFARSNHNSFQVQLRKRFSSGFQFDTSYVLSKSLDNDTNGGSLNSQLADPYNPEHNYGRADWDNRHGFVFSGVWSPPFYESQSGAVGRILGGWTFSGITTAYSGGALTFDSGQDTQLNGTGGRSRADVVGNPKRSHSSRGDMVAQFFNTKAFTAPPIGSVGTSGMGILSGPASVATDLAILKGIRLTEGTRFELRTELLNAFNQVNFSNPVTSHASGNFGRITNAGAGRLIQFGLKFYW